MNEHYFRISFISQPMKQWDDWFDIPLQPEASEQYYIMAGQVQDLAAFIGLLNRFQLLNLNPESIYYGIEPIEPGQAESSKTTITSTD